MCSSFKNLFEGIPSPLESVDISKIPLVVQEDYQNARKRDFVEKDMVEVLTRFMMKEFDCSKTDVYKYWDSFKEVFN